MNMERKVLLFSGRPPMHSAGYVQDIINMLERACCKVDFMTLYAFEGQNENQFNILTKPWNIKVIEILQKHLWLRKFRFLYHLPYKIISKFQHQNAALIQGNYYIVSEKEVEPPIDPKCIFEKINVDYDFYVIMIPQDILTSKTVKMLYDKYQKPVIMMSLDMYNFTGNCFFPNNCTHYLDECRDCPAYKEMGLADSAHDNFIYKKEVFKMIKCAFTCNTQDAKLVRQTKIINENKLFLSSFYLDVDIFKPYDKVACKNSLRIAENKSFIILIRYISPQNVDWRRKGGTYMIETLDKFYNKLSDCERKKCLLFFIGTNSVDPGLNIKFDTYCGGNLNRSELIYAYNASSVFFCPSINDSGPSMVNQSMACSTPVVAFNQGTAIDVIENGKTGFKSELYDTDGLSDALLSLFHMDKESYEKLKNNARQKAVDFNSLEAGAKLFQRIFESFEANNRV